MTTSLMCKLASIVIHADEMISSDGHIFDKIALKQNIEDPEVREWLKLMGPRGRNENNTSTILGIALANRCNHFRKNGPMAIPLANGRVGSWRWLLCETCHAYKCWNIESQTSDNAEWKLPPASKKKGEKHA